MDNVALSGLSDSQTRHFCMYETQTRHFGLYDKYVLTLHALGAMIVYVKFCEHWTSASYPPTATIKLSQSAKSTHYADHTA